MRAGERRWLANCWVAGYHAGISSRYALSLTGCGAKRFVFSALCPLDGRLRGKTLGFFALCPLDGRWRGKTLCFFVPYPLDGRRRGIALAFSALCPLFGKPRGITLAFIALCPAPQYYIKNSIAKNIIAPITFALAGSFVGSTTTATGSSVNKAAHPGRAVCPVAIPIKSATANTIIAR